jgi:hypothetical protein
MRVTTKDTKVPEGRANHEVGLTAKIIHEEKVYTAKNTVVL